MKRTCLASIGLVTCLLIGLSEVGIAEGKTEILYRSPSGAFRAEFNSADGAGTDEAMGDVWIASTKDPTQRAHLPKQSPDSPTDDEFHFSPNEQWLFGLRHVGSGLRYGNFY